jgi:hypothetical protein
MTKMPDKKKNDAFEQKAEASIGRFIRLLVIVAAGIVAVGGALYLHRYWSLLPGYHVFQG